MNKVKKIAVVGAGFTGLTAALRLALAGYQVNVLESTDMPGGLATGFRQPKWSWKLERYYHHLFVTDSAIRSLAHELNHPIIFRRPMTATYLNGEISQLDSPLSLLTFRPLSLLSRVRTGLVLAYLKMTNNWKSLEKLTAKDFLVKWAGRESWMKIWEPLFTGKFSEYSDDIAASWFWARIKKRSSSLGYPKGGFAHLAGRLAQEVIKNGGSISYSAEVTAIIRSGTKIAVRAGRIRKMYDAVVCTLPTPAYLAITKGLPSAYVKNLQSLEGIGGLNMVLELNSSFLPGIYWLNMNDREFPFLALVEHTNYMSPRHYHGRHIVYIGSYLDTSHSYFQMDDKELINLYVPYLKKINPLFRKSWIKHAWVFKAGFSQPIVTRNFTPKIPSLKTPLPGLFLGNIQQVYPWDRGTNYAVELGEKIAKEVRVFLD